MALLAASRDEMFSSSKDIPVILYVILCNPHFLILMEQQENKKSKKKEREKEKRNDGLQKLGGVNYEAVVDRQVKLLFF
jgi:hypothetical protein